jgi:uroporphyrinogen-III synthase
MRLLVTRPEPDASLTANELHDLGHEAVLQPLLEFRGLDFDASTLKIATALIVTSGNALRALQEKLNIGDVAHIPLFCAGEETGRRALQAGFRSIAATACNAEELASKIVHAAPKDSKLIHVTGEHQAFDLAGSLAGGGLSLCTLNVYTMIARAAFEPRLLDQFKSSRIGGVILMSPRTADVFTALCQAHGLADYVKAVRYFCLSETVARKLDPLEPAYLHVAKIPNRRALLELVATSAAAGP